MLARLVAVEQAAPNWEGERHALLSQRISDIGLEIRGTLLEKLVHQLYEDLAAKGLDFRPPVYLSDQWGCPDGTPLIGVPFYLADARLSKIEEDRILASVDAAVTSGKITPAMKGWAIELGKKDEAALASYLDKVVAFGGAVQLGGKVPAPEKGKLTTEEAAICAMTGISHADFLKTRDEEAA